ncbi:MAG: threonine-phosphate decarboxylase CobD [Rhodobacteraceae bacterium]|nr:threonine-phosphate decarboxylase CobD [Paracoccaceae bacterium]
MRDHGGDLDRAAAAYGAGDWLDLSTGINPVPYPLPAIPPAAWTRLPTRAETAALEAAASAAFGTPAEVVAVAGAQAAIQIVPRLAPPGRAAVLWPSYNEHAAALAAQGWMVAQAQDPEAMTGADLAVIVNPNNPDGRRWPAALLADLAGRVGLLVVDESFGDVAPELSLAPLLDRLPNALVLRSFGKFWGLAGLRLGFALASPPLAARLRALAGPWAVGGPAIAVGCAALADPAWAAAARARLAADAARLDALALGAGWGLVGGTDLFRTYAVADASAAQACLARARIWTRVFPHSPGWIRLGLPGAEGSWTRLATALAGGRE